LETLGSNSDPAISSELSAASCRIRAVSRASAGVSCQPSTLRLTAGCNAFGHRRTLMWTSEALSCSLSGPWWRCRCRSNSRRRDCALSLAPRTNSGTMW